ncbi:MAG TPA: hypothetical protein VLT84_09830, partial [Acidobacteriota bacterium]|nr:hypothetical protein [Acidobacteriota bacterium]
MSAACLLGLAFGAGLANDAGAAAAPKAKPELARIRYWTAPDHTRLVFDMTASPGEPRFRMVDSLTYEVYLPGARKSPAITTEFVG